MDRKLIDLLTKFEQLIPSCYKFHSDFEKLYSISLFNNAARETFKHVIEKTILKYKEIYSEHDRAQLGEWAELTIDFYEIGLHSRYVLGSPNEAYFLEESVLFLAIINNNIEKVSKYLKDFINLNLLCSKGKNAICYAVESADIEIIDLLLQRGCSIVNPRGMKENPIKIAFELNKLEVVDFLLEKLVEIPIFHYELLEITFKSDNERLLKLKKIPVLSL